MRPYNTLFQSSTELMNAPLEVNHGEPEKRSTVSSARTRIEHILEERDYSPSTAYPPEQLASWRNELLAIRENLQMCGIYEYHGVWHFYEMKGVQAARLNVSERRPLSTFPSVSFLVSERIISTHTDRNRISQGESIKRLFGALGFTVATPTEEIDRYQNIIHESIPHWREELLAKKSEFTAVGMVEENGRWYFGDLPGINTVIDIRIGNETRLASFPSREFFAARNVVTDPKRGIRSIADLQNLFRALGIAVATPEQEKLRWRELLLAESEALQAVGLRVHEGAWYFSTLQFLRLNRLSVGNRRMRSFPNKAFLVENGIIPPEQDAIQASEAYPKLFEALGIPVTTLEEEQRLGAPGDASSKKEALLLLSKEFQSAGIRCTPEGEWYAFHHASARKLKGIKLLAQHLGLETDRPNGNCQVIVSDGNVQDIRDATRTLFIESGIPVLDGDTEKVLIHGEYQKSIPLWRNELLSHREVLLAGGVLEIGGACSLKYAKMDRLARIFIGSRLLITFPSTIFLRDCGIIAPSSHYIHSLGQIHALFRALQVPALSELAHRPQRIAGYKKHFHTWRTCLIRTKKQLIAAGCFRIGEAGPWSFQGSRTAEIKDIMVGKVPLVVFPSREFLIDMEIIPPSAQKITQLQQVIKLFRLFKIPVLPAPHRSF